MKKTVNASHWTRHPSYMSVLRYYKKTRSVSSVERALAALGLSKRR
jgi:hypothetical protein